MTITTVQKSLLSDDVLAGKVATLYADGLHMKEVAEALGVSDTTVFKIMRKRGIKSRPKGTRRGPVFLSQERYEALVTDLKNQIGTQSSVATKHGVDRCYVRFLCRKYGITYYQRENRNLRLFGTPEDQKRKKDANRKARYRDRMISRYSNLIELWKAGSSAKDIASELGQSERYVFATVSRLRYAYPDVFPARREAATRLSEDDYKFRSACREHTKRAIERGDLVRIPCEKCGNPKSEVHHPDYHDPMNVKWLCKKHHWEEHAKHFAIGLKDPSQRPQRKSIAANARKRDHKGKFGSNASVFTS